MTKASANPRRYSRGIENLDENQPLNVYLAIHVDPSELKATADRLQYLAHKHAEAVIDIAGYRREEGQLVLTLAVNMGPAREALRGTSIQVHAGYQLLWDLAKTLFYARPIFTSPPGDSERANVHTMGQLFTPRTSAPTPVEALRAS